MKIYQNSATYPGLKDLSQHSLILKLIIAHEFELNMCITIYLKQNQYILRTIRWDSIPETMAMLGTTKALKNNPYTYGSDRLIPKEIVDKIIDSYATIRNPQIFKPIDMSCLRIGRSIMRYINIPQFQDEGAWEATYDNSEIIDSWSQQIIDLIQ